MFRRPFPRLFVSLFVLGVVTYTGLTTAQQLYSTDQLFSAAHSSWNDRDFVHAYGYIEAYFQRDPPALRESRFRDEMVRWRQIAYDSAVMPRNTATTGGTAGGPIGKSQQGLSYAPPASEPQPPRSYRMDCRGGGSMHANYYPTGDYHRLEIHFAKSSRSSSAGLPADGECAWVDRPISNAEPFWLNWTIDPRQLRIGRVMFGSNRGVPGFSLSPNSGQNVSGLIMEVVGSPLERLIEAIHRDQAFSVECYNDGNGHFVVTRLISAG